MIMHYSCIRTFISFFLVLYVDWCFSVSLSLSLSLSQIVCTWDPSTKLLCLKILFVPGHLLPTLLHFMLGSVMRMPVKTSWRTSPNVAFIQNATLSYQTSPILLYPLSFTVRVGISMSDTRELSHRDHTRVLLQYAWFRYLYTLVCYIGLRYTYHSHTKAYLLCTTRSKGGVS